MMTQLHSFNANTLKFDWNNHDNRPEGFHFVIDESNVADVFEDRNYNKPITDTEYLQKGYWGVALKAKFTDMMYQQSFGDPKRASLDVPGLVVVDIADSLLIPFNSIVKSIGTFCFDDFLRFVEQKGFVTPLAYRVKSGDYEGDWRKVSNNGITGPSEEGFVPFTHGLDRKEHHRPTTLHFDTRKRDGRRSPDGIPFLSFIHGKRVNIDEQSALSIYTDFAQWYEDQGYETPIDQLDVRELVQLILENSQTLEDEYTLTLPDNKGFTRFTLFSQNPLMRGLLHSVTPYKPVLPDQDVSREMYQRFIYEKGYLLEELSRTYLRE